MSRTNSRNMRYLKQSVQITGFGNEAFDKLTTDMAKIFTIFKRAIRAQLQDEPSLLQDEEGFMAIDAANQYFTFRTGRSDNNEIPITDDMDPKGYLRKVAGTLYIHTEENKVYYFEKCEHSAGR